MALPWQSHHRDGPSKKVRIYVFKCAFVVVGSPWSAATENGQLTKDIPLSQNDTHYTNVACRIQQRFLAGAGRSHAEAQRRGGRGLILDSLVPTLRGCEFFRETDDSLFKLWPFFATDDSPRRSRQ